MQYHPYHHQDHYKPLTFSFWAAQVEVPAAAVLLQQSLQRAYSSICIVISFSTSPRTLSLSLSVLCVCTITQQQNNNCCSSWKTYNLRGRNSSSREKKRITERGFLFSSSLLCRNRPHIKSPAATAAATQTTPSSPPPYQNTIIIISS